jgi:hypothetical protein
VPVAAALVDQLLCEWLVQLPQLFYGEEQEVLPGEMHLAILMLHVRSFPPLR